MINIFTCINNHYKTSPELQLSLDLLKQRLQNEGTRLTLINEENETFIEKLTSIADNEYFLFIEQPWMFISKNMLPELKDILENNAAVDCALPSDSGAYRQGAPMFNYHTLRGFDRFVENLYDAELTTIPYDQRAAFAFMIKGKALKNIDFSKIESIFDIPESLKESTRIALNAYIHKPMMDYFGENRQEILEFIPDCVKSLLDIGCSTGNFGQLVKQELGCHVAGIDLNPNLIDQAAKVLDNAILGDALKVQLEQKVDCVTGLDSLEHFVEPDALLNKIYNDYLTDNGYLILSVPNVGHWSIIEDLLAGHWDYIPMGLLCNTHLRFFTLNTLKDLLAKHGFTILKTDAYRVPPTDQNLLTLIEFIQNSPLTIDKDNMDVVSYHILAQKTPGIR